MQHSLPAASCMTTKGDQGRQAVSSAQGRMEPCADRTGRRLAGCQEPRKALEPFPVADRGGVTDGATLSGAVGMSAAKVRVFLGAVMRSPRFVTATRVKRGVSNESNAALVASRTPWSLRHPLAVSVRLETAKPSGMGCSCAVKTAQPS